MVELAITLPVMLMLSVAAADFSRLFWESTVIAEASATGARYGGRNNRTAAEDSQMQTLTGNATRDVSSTVTTSTRVCFCPDGNGGLGASANCYTGSCPNYGMPRAYVKVDTTKTFSTMGYFPGVPQNVPISLKGYMRVH